MTPRSPEPAMSETDVKRVSLPRFGVWDKAAASKVPLSFELELTARCNNDCRHCYINLPAGDSEAQKKELTIAQISHIADQAVELGSLWCLLTGANLFCARILSIFTCG